MGEVIEENDLGRHIRYRHRIDAASWSSETNRWTRRRDAHRHRRARSASPRNFLWMCQGYYRHAEGYTPEWPGMDRFEGRIVHPQTWPEDLDYTGKNVLVIGSGATAATLVPAIAARLRARHDAAALADLLLPGAEPQRARRHAARARDRRDVDPRDRAPQDPARPAGAHAALRSRSPSSRARSCSTACAPVPARGLRRGDALHAEVPAVAAAPRLRARRRPVPGHQSPARRRWSPTRSSASPRRASC